MLTKQDLQSIREVMREEIQVSVPPIVERIIDAKVPGMIERGVAGHFADIMEVINDMNNGINSKFDGFIGNHESRIVRLEIKIGHRN